MTLSRNKNGMDELIDTLLILKTRQQLHDFFKDLCTPAELKALSERFKVCQLLENDSLSYRDIHKSTGASLTTIGRVARFLRDENYGGYKNALNLIKETKNAQ